ncbi:MAG: NAD(P)-dependent oxidoreductase [Actinomycetota bacterium]
MKVYLTGATGVVGRRTLPALIAAGHDVTAVARSDDKADAVGAAGATASRVDVFDRTAVAEAVAGHDAVIHLATNIPTGADAAVKRGWRMNDRLRTEAAANLRDAATAAGVGRFVQESITFPYLPNGDGWIDENHPCDYFWGNDTARRAEAGCHDFTTAGGSGIVLRFGLFFAADSAHVQTFVTTARKGLWTVTGSDDTPVSWIHVDDAGAAVVAALEAPAGTYNVAEPDPLARAEHRSALADVVGRDRLRAIPAPVQRALGAALETVSRAHRIDSTRLGDVTGWQPVKRVVDHWKDCA